jgi:hypothetical protein
VRLARDIFLFILCVAACALGVCVAFVRLLAEALMVMEEPDDAPEPR